MMRTTMGIQNCRSVTIAFRIGFFMRNCSQVKAAFERQLLRLN